MPQTLAQRVRAKYPGSYDDLTDAALERSVLAKHPEYADLAQQKPLAPTIDTRALSELDPNIPADADPSGGPILKWIKAHPGTAGAMAGGLLAPLTGGASLLGGGLGGTMLAEAGAAGAGTIAGNALASKPQDVRETLINSSLGSAGPALGPIVRGVVRSPLAKEAAIEGAAHAAGVGMPVRIARAVMRVGKTIEPEAARAPTVIRPAGEVIDETLAARPKGWLDTPIPEDAPAPTDTAGRTLGGYAGPERRAVSRPPASEDALYAASRADREHAAAGFKQTSTAAQENATAHDRQAALADRYGYPLDKNEQAALDGELEARGYDAGKVHESGLSAQDYGTRSARQTMHRTDADLNARYRHLLNDPLASLLLTGGIGAIMSKLNAQGAR